MTFKQPPHDPISTSFFKPRLFVWILLPILSSSCERRNAETDGRNSQIVSQHNVVATQIESHGAMGSRDSYDHVLLADDQVAIVGALSALAKSAPRDALLFIDKALASKHSEFIEYELLEPLLEMCRAGNSQMVMEWLAKHPKQSGEAELVDLFRWVIANDVELALSMAPSFSGETQLRILNYGFFWLAKHDYEAAMQRARALPPDAQLGPLRGIVGAAIVLQRFEDAFEIARGLNITSRERSVLLSEVMGAWLGGDKIRGLEALKNVDSRDATALLANPSFQRILMMSMEATDALDILLKVPLTGATQSSYQSVLNQVAEKAPEAVLSEIKKLPPSPVHNNLLRGVFAKITGQDLGLAIQQAAQLTGGEQTMALRGITNSLVLEHPERALEVAAGAQPGPQQQEVYREIGRTSAYQNPANAVKMLEDPVVSDKLGAEFRQNMINSTVTTWANQDLQAAKRWVETLPESDAPNAVQGLMTTWMKSDPMAASGWLSTQPQGLARDAGARVLISQIKDTDPEMAEQWRKTLPPVK
jgi:hypothetical protein